MASAIQSGTGALRLKDQYFGDVNDFRKYGLLRALTASGDLRLGICWMLTANDGRKDGNLLGYLASPVQFRHRDPALFDWLKRVVEVEKVRRTSQIESSGLLGPAVFQSTILTDRSSERLTFFDECRAIFSECDLVFFDPDNGLEVRSRPRGRRNSCKHLYWDELCTVFLAGSSVLVYQHFIREERCAYAERIGRELRSRTGAPAEFLFRTPHVLFVLAAQVRHVESFRSCLQIVEFGWKGHIEASELAM